MKTIASSAPLAIATIFSGGGLIECGTIEAGFKPIWGVECDREIANWHKINFGTNLICDRAENVDFSKLPIPDAIHASPPCPNFSVAKIGAKESTEDISAAKAVARAIDKLMPRIFTLENVPKYKSSQSWQLIANTLYDLGYFISAEIVDSASYGVPQLRKRLIVRALLGDIPPDLPAAKNSFRGWYSAIADLNLPESKLARWQQQRIKQQNLTFAEDKAYLIERVGARDNMRIREGDRPAWTIKANIGTDGKGANRKDFLNAIVDGKIFTLTSRALGRLQTLPDWYQLPDSTRLAVTIVGNGVPCLLAKIIFRQFVPFL